MLFDYRHFILHIRTYTLSPPFMGNNYGMPLSSEIALNQYQLPLE